VSARARRWARVAGAVAAFGVVLCTVVLVADYAHARASLQADTARVAALQEGARTDAAVARVLEAEQSAVTRRRLARNRRTERLGLALLLLSAGFVGSMKWRIAQGPRRPASHAPVHAAAVPAALAWPALAPADRRDEEPALEVVRRIVQQEGASAEAAIRILQRIQAHYRYLPDAALTAVTQLTEVTPAQLAGTSSFYARFRRSPVGERVIRVCHGTACHVAGARHITDELRRCLGVPEGEDTDPARRFTIDEVACVGCCSLAPVVMVDEHTAGRLTPEGVRTLVGIPGPDR
jgi:NADH:ubiquinone oxidoreductase subunit E